MTKGVEKHHRRSNESLTRHLSQALLKANMSRFGRETGEDPLADVLLRDAMQEGASDVHLDPQSDGIRVRLRIDGHLHDAMLLTPEHGIRLIRHFQAIAGMDATPFKPGDARLVHRVDGHTLYLRLAAVPSICGEKLSIRILDRDRIDRRLHQLGFSDEHFTEVTDWLSNISGLFLVAGPTGSGKTTTLYALLHELKLRQRSIVTIEDPVEYQIDGIVQIQADARHGLDLDQGLRTMLRLDPDYLLLGEIRSTAAARAAVESAGSGRVLMSTIHSTDAVGAVTSLRNLGLQDHEIATSLRLVMAQRLVRVLCQHCRRREPVTPGERQWLQAVGLPCEENCGGAEVWHAVGCEECRQIGYQGRIGIFEIWRLTEEDCGRILAHADERTVRIPNRPQPIRSLLQDGYAKAIVGTTSLDELRHVAADYIIRSPAPGP